MENRTDGTNINHWHWHEKNLLPWSRQRIDELVKGLTADLDASLGSAEVTGVKELNGEVICLLESQIFMLCKAQPHHLSIWAPGLTSDVSCLRRHI